MRLIGEAGREIGVAVANLCNVINPDRVIIGGDLSGAGDLITETKIDLRMHSWFSRAIVQEIEAFKDACTEA